MAIGPAVGVGDTIGKPGAMGGVITGVEGVTTTGLNEQYFTITESA